VGADLLADAITAAGASLKSLGEPWVDTTTAAGKMVLTVFAGIAEFERALIRDRTGAGRFAAKKRVKFSRKPKLTPEQVALALRLVDEASRCRRWPTRSASTKRRSTAA
jgi:DNA invertase Pin-like site-specific DNA recombinase